MTTDEKQMAGAATERAQLVVRAIGMAEIKSALAKGLADFNAKPSHLIFLGMIYPVLMVIFARVSAGYEVLPLVFPLLAGSALLGPVAAIGLYELSRRREAGLDVAWKHLFYVLRSHSLFAIITLGIVLGAIFLAWMLTAHALYLQFFSAMAPASIEDFAWQVLGTSSGWGLIIVGCGVGFVYAVVVLTISVVSFPLLLDRDVSAVMAVLTSVRAVVASPAAMAAWGLIVAGSLVIGALPFFVGWCVVMPVLGHATWHLYRSVVEP